MKTSAYGGKWDAVPLLLDVRGVAAMLGISRASVFRMRDSGKLPQPVRLGGCVRWPVEVIEAWVRDGCPDLDGRIPKR